MSDDVEKAREEGEKDGRRDETLKNHGIRLSRLEKALVGVVAAIIAAWAKDRGLW